MKLVPVTLISLLAIAGAVHAQENWSEVDDDDMLVEPLGVTADELEDMNLYGPADEYIGEVDDVLIGDDGTSMAVSLDVGGFLGIGDKDVVIPLGDLTKIDQGVQVDMSKEELEALPDYDD